MRGLRTSLVLVLVAAGVLAAARLTVRAQERPAVDQPPHAGGTRSPLPGREPSKAEPDMAGPTVQEALSRPFAFPFAEPTSLAEVGEYLQRTL
jgi:hypothetical protein